MIRVKLVYKNLINNMAKKPAQVANKSLDISSKVWKRPDKIANKNLNISNRILRDAIKNETIITKR